MKLGCPFSRFLKARVIYSMDGRALRYPSAFVLVPSSSGSHITFQTQLVSAFHNKNSIKNNRAKGRPAIKKSISNLRKSFLKPHFEQTAACFHPPTLPTSQASGCAHEMATSWISESPCRDWVAVPLIPTYMNWAQPGV